MKKWMLIWVLINFVSQIQAQEEQARNCQLFISNLRVLEISHGIRAIEATIIIGDLPENAIVESVGFWGQEYMLQTLTKDWHLTPPDFRLDNKTFHFTFLITHEQLVGYLSYKGTFFIRLNNSHRFWINPNSNPDDHYIFDMDLLRFLRHMQLLPSNSSTVSTLDPNLSQFNHLKCK